MVYIYIHNTIVLITIIMIVTMTMIYANDIYICLGVSMTGANPNLWMVYHVKSGNPKITWMMYRYYLCTVMHYIYIHNIIILYA